MEPEEPQLDLQWSDDEEEKEEEAEASPPQPHKNGDTEPAPAKPKSGKLDIMAHQLKFIACLKIIAEELSTLATGIEADGGTLRRQFYMWLEKEVRNVQSLYFNLWFDEGPVNWSNTSVQTLCSITSAFRNHSFARSS